VAGGLADPLDVGRADAALAGRDAGAGRGYLAREVGLQGGHAGVYQKQGIVPLGYKREAREPQMPLGLEK